MKEVNARTAKNQFGQLLDSAQRGPVRVTRYGRSAGILMSEDHYHRLQGIAWDRLHATIKALREKARTQGLAEEKLARLLSDDG